MYESKINICRYRIRNTCLPRPPPDNRVVAIYSRSKDNRWHGR